MASKPVISLLLTAHREGLVAHKTMLSLFDAAKPLGEQDAPYEILVHIDNGDDATSGYFARYDNDPRISVFHNHFGDLGMSRNFLAQQARGTYVAFLDADDLVSPNWLVTALDLLVASPDEVIVHPAAVLIFQHSGGSAPVLWLQNPSNDKWLDTQIMLGHNRWAAVYATTRELVCRLPYQPTGKGIGYEDWSFNTQTVAAGVRHAAAPDTVMFYRKRNNSLLQQSDQQHVLQPYCDLFDIMQINNHQPEALPPSSDLAQVSRNRPLPLRIASTMVRLVARQPLLRRVVRRPYELLVRGRRLRQLRDRVPPYVVNAWAKMNAIERQLYPTLGTLFAVTQFQPDDPTMGQIFQQLVRPLNTLPDYVFLVPCLAPSDVIQALLNYLWALKQTRPDWAVAVIGTVPSLNDSAVELPDDVSYLDFGNLTAGLADHERDILMSRLIVQMRTTRWHIINSEEAYRWMSRHARYVTGHGYTVNVSVFPQTVAQPTDGPVDTEYDDPLLIDIYPLVNKILTNSEAFAQEIVGRNGFASSRCIGHSMPTEADRNESSDNGIWRRFVDEIRTDLDDSDPPRAK